MDLSGRHIGPKDVPAVTMSDPILTLDGRTNALKVRHVLRSEHQFLKMNQRACPAGGARWNGGTNHDNGTELGKPKAERDEDSQEKATCGRKGRRSRDSLHSNRLSDYAKDSTRECLCKYRRINDESRTWSIPSHANRR
jgi:hypothetical protein